MGTQSISRVLGLPHGYTVYMYLMGTGFSSWVLGLPHGYSVYLMGSQSTLIIIIANSYIAHFVTERNTNALYQKNKRQILVQPINIINTLKTCATN